MPERLQILLCAAFVFLPIDRREKKSYNYSNKLEKDKAVSIKENKKSVGVYTHNDYLFQKIKLALPENATALRLDKGSDTVCDLVLVDGEDGAFSDIGGLRMKKEGGDIPLPFSIDALSSLFEAVSSGGITLIEAQRSVRLADRTVKLTELEYRLLALLLSARGSFVDRERILSDVWGEKADKGIINVYIHYLREKLETDGEKIILSSRNYGYRISEKYLGGNG